MTSALALLLVCATFSTAKSLTCRQCVLPQSGCTEPATCQDRCLTSTTSMYISGSRWPDTSMQTCGVASMCVSGSMNVGAVKVVTNAKCCNTDLCNSETLPADFDRTPNGRMCYTCADASCADTLSCEGSEDHCITAWVKQGGNTLTMKGCVSKSICTASESLNMGSIGTAQVRCCQGNLCNAARSFTLSFLLTAVPLLSCGLFY